MVERPDDKKRKILTEICDNPFPLESNSDIPADILRDFTNNLKTGKLIDIRYVGPVPINEDQTRRSESIIVHYNILDRKRLIKLLERYRKQYPKKKNPFIRLKALELIAIKMGIFNTSSELIDLLETSGVDPELIIYTNTKWKMVYDIFAYLTFSDIEEDIKALSKIICNFVHPLNLKGSSEESKKIQKEFNSYLYYDNLWLEFNEKKGEYLINSNPSDEEMEQIQNKFWEKERKHLPFLHQPKNIENISLEQDETNNHSPIKIEITNLQELEIKEANNKGEIKNENKIKEAKKIDIFIDKDYGIYKNKKTKDPCYPLKKDTKRFRVLKYLSQSKSLSPTKLKEKVDQEYSALNKAIKEINEKFKFNLNLKHDLISQSPIKAYLLNKDKYNIIFK